MLHFCNSMTPWFQFLTMIALFKTWLSKSWNLLGYQISKLDPYQIYVFHDLVFQANKIIDTTWQTIFLNLSFFVQDLACQVLKCYIVLQIHVPKSWQWLHYSRLGFPSLEFFWGNYFHDPRKNYVFITCFSKTWSQENDCQDLADQFLKSNTFLFKTWHAKIWNVKFLQLHVSNSGQWLHYSRLGFPSLETFWGTKFQN